MPAGVFSAGFPASAEQNQIIHQDLGPVFLLAAFLVVPGTGAQAAFDVDLAAFFQVLAHNFRGALKCDQIVPLGVVLPLAVLVLVTLVGSHGKLGHGHAALGVLDLGIFAEIADQN